MGDEMDNASAHNFEQQRLGKVWTLIGRKDELPEDQDWFTTELGGRSIFVQRFGDDLRAFENSCAHRFFPLRNGCRGNGPVICGFHHWRYNKDGVATVIPNCEMYFGSTPRELDLRLRAVQLESCGPWLFGRFEDGAAPESLASFLGPAFDVLSRLSETDYVLSESRVVKANWRQIVKISMDDYHLVAVHPKTLGNSGYVKRSDITYGHWSAHSFYATSSGINVEEIAAACRNRSFQPTYYQIINLFPNLALATFHVYNFAGRAIWYSLLEQVIATAPDESTVRSWIWRTPTATEDPRWLSLMLRASEPIRARLVRHFVSQVQSEDGAICEALERNVPSEIVTPSLSYVETRLGWFDATLEKFLRDGRWWTNERVHR